MKKKILANKLVHLRLSILELGKILIHEFWHEFWCDYVKPKYGFLPYMKTNQIIFIKILQKMLKLHLNGTTLIDHYLKEKMKK